MRIFEKGGKVNFVDVNNTLVGFDMNQDCCESFGYSITKTVPEGCCEDKQLTEEELEPYCFADEPPVQHTCRADFDEGGSISFKLAASDKPNIFVTLFNAHNGYYSHGFTMEVGGTLALEGSL